MEEQMFYLIKDVGVPTFFSGMLAILLYKVVNVGAGVISKNTDAIIELKTTIRIMSGKMEIKISE